MFGNLCVPEGGPFTRNTRAPPFGHSAGIPVSSFQFLADNSSVSDISGYPLKLIGYSGVIRSKTCHKVRLLKWISLRNGFGKVEVKMIYGSFVKYRVNILPCCINSDYRKISTE